MAANQKYQMQVDANFDAFCYDERFGEKRKGMEELLEVLKDCKWVLTCSCNLFFRGIVDDFHDFDVIIDKDAIDIVKNRVKGFEKIDQGDQSYYNSDYFERIKLPGGMGVDIVSEWGVTTYGTFYKYGYKEEEKSIIDVNAKYSIPLAPVESLAILYAMMQGQQPRRLYKRNLCFSYLKKTEVKYPQIIEDGLKKFHLPACIRNDLKQIS